MNSFYHSDNEEENFKNLFENFKKPVHDYALAVTGDHDTAEDIAQEIFIRLWKKRDDLTRIEHIDNYVFRMVRNECMDFFNKVARDGKLAASLKMRMALGGNTTYNHLDYKETANLIEKGVAILSPQRKKIYQLSRRQGLSLHEIADQMGLSYNTVKNHLVEALKQLRKYLHDNDAAYLLILLLAFFRTVALK